MMNQLETTLTTNPPSSGISIDAYMAWSFLDNMVAVPNPGVSLGSSAAAIIRYFSR